MTRVKLCIGVGTPNWLALTQMAHILAEEKKIDNDIAITPGRHIDNLPSILQHDWSTTGDSRPHHSPLIGQRLETAPLPSDWSTTSY